LHLFAFHGLKALDGVSFLGLFGYQTAQLRVCVTSHGTLPNWTDWPDLLGWAEVTRRSARREPDRSAYANSILSCRPTHGEGQTFQGFQGHSGIVWIKQSVDLRTACPQFGCEKTVSAPIQSRLSLKIQT